MRLTKPRRSMGRDPLAGGAPYVRTIQCQGEVGDPGFYIIRLREYHRGQEALKVWGACDTHTLPWYPMVKCSSTLYLDIH